MLMVIFGAGASHDSASDFPLPRRFDGDTGGPWRPPLGKDLFRNPNLAFGHIIRRYAKMQHILPLLRDPTPGRTVEEELEFLKAQGGAERLREFASVRYYLRDLLFDVTKQWEDKTDKVTNYSPLIGEILRLNNGNEPVCLVTFNYDLLLDHALLSYGYSPQDPENQFRAHQVLQLFKPHGSVDWVRFLAIPSTDRLRPNSLIQEADRFVPTNEWARVGSPAAADDFALGRTVFPAIAVPVQNKTHSTFECPASHLKYLGGCLSQVTKILIIGWQAREAHFLEILRSSGLPRLKHLMVVAENPGPAQRTLVYFAQQTGKEIGKDLLEDNCRTGNGGFSDFILRREAAPFLQA